MIRIVKSFDETLRASFNHEIAELLKLNPPAASMRYLRALRRLRSLLEETPLDVTEQGSSFVSDVGIETSEDREQRLADVLSNAADAVYEEITTDLHSMYQEHRS